MTTQNLTIIAKGIIKASPYTLEEITSEYKANKSESFRRGYFASRGFNWLQGQVIEKGLSLR